jgi:excinuclease UvrABC nuclease subunit
MKKCVGPCIGAITQEEYRDLCKEVARFLKGQSDEVKRTVKEKMTAASDRMQYEKAASYRDILAAIETLGERQIISTLAHSGKFTEQNEDYLGLARCGDVTAMVVLKKRTGRIIASEYYFLDGEEIEDTSGEDDKAVFEAFIPQKLRQGSRLPRRIFVPKASGDEGGLEFLSPARRRNACRFFPLNGERNARPWKWLGRTRNFAPTSNSEKCTGFGASSIPRSSSCSAHSVCQNLRFASRGTTFPTFPGPTPWVPWSFFKAGGLIEADIVNSA